MKAMNFKLLIPLLTIACALSLQAQGPPRAHGGMAMGGMNRSPNLSGSMGQLFGDNKAFTANIEMQTTAKGSDAPITVPGKIAFLDGKTRFEMNMADMKGSAAGSAGQMKAMGMDRMINISRPDKKVSYIVYPGLQAYMETPQQNADPAKPDSDYKVEVTEQARETVDGHPCVKNNVVVSDKDNNKHQSTTWNATDLSKFPVKIEQTENGSLTTMLFKDVKLSKPDASLFDPPADAKKYDSMQAMMQEVMMKRLSNGGAGVPPARPVPEK
jgi:hypothetical protein